MNPLIEKQLGKLFIAGEGKPDGDGIVFSRVSLPDVEVGKTYGIRVDLNMLGCDAIAYNMNAGKLPLCSEMTANIMSISKGVAQVTAAYRGMQGMWSGWLPLDQIEVAEEVA